MAKQKATKRGDIPIGDGSQGIIPNGDGPQGFCLGKRPPVFDSRTLRMGVYLLPKTRVAPTIPDSADWAHNVDQWPTYDNDRYGDCTCAAAGHMVQAWTASAGKMRTPSERDVLALYEHFTIPGPENGCNMLAVLKYWRKHGMGKDKIAAFASLEPKNAEEMKDAVWMFGGCYIGVALPKFATASSNALNVPWVVPPQGLVGDAAPDPQLGHCICAVAYDSRNLYVVTWGAVKSMSWQFYNAYADEAYAVLSTDFLTGEHKTPNGFDLAKLQADLQEITQIPAKRAAIYHLPTRA